MGSERTEQARAGDALIAGAGFDSAALAPANRFAAWRAYMEPAQDIRPVPGSSCDPSLASTGWAVDDLVCSDLAFSPISYRRRGGRDSERWRFNLKVGNYSAPGTYAISMISGDGAAYVEGRSPRLLADQVGLRRFSHRSAFATGMLDA